MRKEHGLDKIISNAQDSARPLCNPCRVWVHGNSGLHQGHSVPRRPAVFWQPYLWPTVPKGRHCATWGQSILKVVTPAKNEPYPPFESVWLRCECDDWQGHRDNNGQPRPECAWPPHLRRCLACQKCDRVEGSDSVAVQRRRKWTGQVREDKPQVFCAECWGPLSTTTPMQESVKRFLKTHGLKSRDWSGIKQVRVDLVAQYGHRTGLAPGPEKAADPPTGPARQVILTSEKLVRYAAERS